MSEFKQIDLKSKCKQYVETMPLMMMASIQLFAILESEYNGRVKLLHDIQEKKKNNVPKPEDYPDYDHGIHMLTMQLEILSPLVKATDVTPEDLASGADGFADRLMSMR